MKLSAAAGIFTQKVYPLQDLNPDAISGRRFLGSRSTKLSDRGMKKFIYS